MRKLLTTLAALICAGSISFAANIPLLTGPVDPGNAAGTINTLIQSINSGTAGLFASVATPVAAISTTVQQTLASAVIPTGTFTAPGQSIRARCAGITAANVDTKTVGLTFGAGIIASSASITATSASWELELVVTAAQLASPGQFQYFSRGSNTTTVIAPTAGSDTTDSATTGITVACIARQGTSTPADITAENFLVEVIK
jgi:hypothetical protein